MEDQCSALFRFKLITKCRVAPICGGAAPALTKKFTKSYPPTTFRSNASHSQPSYANICSSWCQLIPSAPAMKSIDVFQDDVTIAIDDVRLCTVRNVDDVERRFCFEVISPGKSFLLQADSAEVREAWISAVQVTDLRFLQRGNGH